MKIVLLLLTLTGPALAHDTPKPSAASIGGAFYRTCYMCHSLESGVHLTGPSLANLWNRPAGQVAGYGLYSEALKSSKLKWNEKTLRQWLGGPEHLVPGTTMTYALKDKAGLEQLIEFLKLALGPEGLKKVTEQNLITRDTALGQRPEDLAQPADAVRVTSVVRCQDRYTVTTADQKVHQYWDQNLDLKVVTGPLAPPNGMGVMSRTGSMGDRFKVVFSSLSALKTLVAECPTKP